MSRTSEHRRVSLCITTIGALRLASAVIRYIRFNPFDLHSEADEVAIANGTKPPRPKVPQEARFNYRGMPYPKDHRTEGEKTAAAYAFESAVVSPGGVTSTVFGTVKRSEAENKMEPTIAYPPYDRVKLEKILGLAPWQSTSPAAAGKGV